MKYSSMHLARLNELVDARCVWVILMDQHRKVDNRQREKSLKPVENTEVVRTIRLRRCRVGEHPPQARYAEATLKKKTSLILRLEHTGAVA